MFFVSHHFIKQMIDYEIFIETRYNVSMHKGYFEAKNDS
jgi:hypothetical protein